LEIRVKLSGPSERPLDLHNARRMFQNVLPGWASDVLMLRKKGLDRPSLREGKGYFAPFQDGSSAASAAPRRRAA